MCTYWTLHHPASYRYANIHTGLNTTLNTTRMNIIINRHSNMETVVIFVEFAIFLNEFQLNSQNVQCVQINEK